MPVAILPESEIGRKYGKLTVLQYVGQVSQPSGRKFPEYVCECECGGVGTFSIYKLRSGNTTSCGCVWKSSITKHGHCSRAGASLEYATWESMVARCSSKKPATKRRYLDRGIAVCPEWLGEGGFAAFLAHIGPRPSAQHSIDRIHNDLGYEPGNVRWATAIEQASNKHNNHIVTYKGREMTLAQACREAGVCYDTTLHRIRAGWSVDRALEPSVS